MTLAPGIYDLSAADYHADPSDEPSLSAHIAHTLLTRSPLHAWTNSPRLNPEYERTERASFDLGTAVHDLWLRSKEDTVHIVEANDWRTKHAQEQKAIAYEAGRVPLLAKDWQRVREMTDAIRAQLAERDDDPPLFAPGKAEQTLVWQERAATPAPVWCRALVDHLHGDFSCIDDLKTVPSKGGTANPRDWVRTFWGIGADVQAVFNQMGVKALTGKTPDFRFIVVEGRPPYALSVVDLAPPVVDLATRKIEYALRVWRDCLDRDEWPAYDKRVHSVELDWRQEERFEDLLWDPDAEQEDEAA